MQETIEIDSIVEEALIQIRHDPRHNLTLATRIKLYDQLEPEYYSGNICRVWGSLGVITAKKVLPFWKKSSYWLNIIGEGFEPVDIKKVPEYLIATAEKVIAGELDFDAARSIADEYHSIVGSIGDEIIEYNENAPQALVCISDAAYESLLMAIGSKPFRNFKGWDQESDDELPTEILDVGGTAMLAYAGGNSIKRVNFKKRQEFWEWWLTEAVPQAIKAGNQPVKRTGKE